MHIRKRGNKWVAIVELEADDKTKKRNQKWITQEKGETKKELEDRAKEIELQSRKGEYFEASNITVEKYFEFWIDKCCAELAPGTLRNYKIIINNHINPNYGQIQLDKFKPLHIQQIYNDLASKPDTRIYAYKVMHKAFKQAAQLQFIKYSPLNNLEPPKKERKEKKKVWDNDTISSCVSGVEDKIIYMPVLICSATGMRRSEACGLTWDCINLKEKTIHIKGQIQRIASKLQLVEFTKTSSSNRIVKISDEIVSLLKKYKIEREKDIAFFSLEEGYHNKILRYDIKTKESKEVANNLVCSWQDGRPLDPSYVTRNFRKAIGNLNLPKIRLHDLRHSHATVLLKAGIDLYVVSKRLGHSSTKVTEDIYIHDDPEMQTEAADIIKIKTGNSKKTQAQ